MKQTSDGFVEKRQRVQRGEEAPMRDVTKRGRNDVQAPGKHALRTTTGRGRERSQMWTWREKREKECVGEALE